MAWESDDGEHQGWAAVMFTDDRVSVGTIGGQDGGVMVRKLGPLGVEYEMNSQPDVLDGRESLGWRGVCECGWRGLIWQRVHSPGEHDPASRRVYDPDIDLYADAPDVVENAVHREWAEHLEPESLTAVREAAAEARAAQARLGDAVLAARRNGYSWAEVGTAAGITRQSAHERWAHLDRTETTE